MVDALSADGYIPGSISVAGNSKALVSDSSPIFVVDPYRFEKFNPIDWMDDVEQDVKDSNKASTLASSFFADTYSDALFQAIGENNQIFQVMNDTVLDTEFNNTRLDQQFSTIAKMIKTRDTRNANRDIFYSHSGGFDTHFNIEPNLASRLTELDTAIYNLRNELIAQDVWDETAIVIVSEFGRTLFGNSGSGSDHAWG